MKLLVRKERAKEHEAQRLAEIEHQLQAAADMTVAASTGQGSVRVLYINVGRRSTATSLGHIYSRIIAGYGPDIIALGDCRMLGDRPFIIPGWDFKHTDLGIKYGEGVQVFVTWNPLKCYGAIALSSVSQYTISLTIGSIVGQQQLLRLSYLPPEMGIGSFIAELNLRQEHEVGLPEILVGDFNARMHRVTEDTATNCQGSRFHKHMAQKGLTLVSQTPETHRVPTFVGPHRETMPTTMISGTSIIDYVAVAPHALNAVSGFHLVHTNNAEETATTSRIVTDHRGIEFDIAVAL
ncbi:hypothetical protein GGH94_004351 [Coemansia aciculifera]|uniref:Endonuclease/exonuclease/phosphatase domain-containing protein n=1 Tax=Coemansia aciculifera TaxID=417176 RepID=A0A9W8IKI5_9FUNG|nr:hypothetical protein GGH94_004351 [Coemansia aciculifera]